jgi:CBS domain-containing protein
MTFIPSSVSIADVMTRATITSRADASIESLIGLMTTNHIGCIPIVNSENHPVGIVTKLDLVECRDASRKVASDVMMPCAMTLAPTDSMARAAKLMSAESFHHVLVVDSKRSLVGVLSTFDVARWVASCS